MSKSVEASKIEVRNSVADAWLVEAMEKNALGLGEGGLYTLTAL